MLSIKCERCQHNFRVALQAMPLPAPYSDVAQMMIRCPECGYERTTHFLSPVLIQKQIEMRHAISEWKKIQNRRNFNRLTRLKEEYKFLFDKEQEKYKNFLEKKISLSLEKVGDDYDGQS